VGNLTDRQINTAKPEAKDCFLNDGGGLYLRVRQSGGKYWLYRYKIGTTTKWFDIGTYPGTSLLDARKEALRLKLLRESGMDPIEQHTLDEAIKIANTEASRQELARQKARLTISQLFDRWERTELKRRRDKGAEARRSFEKDVFPTIRDIAAQDVTRAMVAAILDKVVERDAPIVARYLLGDLRQMFSFAVKRGITDHDPTSHLKRNDYGKKTERERVLSEAELKELKNKIPDAKLQESTTLAIWLVLSTICRIGELSKAQWCDVDLDTGTWRIPADNTKNGKEHTIYLSDFSVKHFEKLKKINGDNRWCYPAAPKADGKKPAEHICLKAITKQIHDRQRKIPLENRSKSTSTLVLSGGDWTPHDLRRTGATMMGTLGVRPDVIEKCLNHVEQNKLIRIYQRQELKTEQREAWRLLGKRLAQVLRNQPSKKVAPQNSTNQKEV
jgi:integrase